MAETEKKTVLFAVLDWGLGHASRSIPLIEKLKSLGLNILLGGCGASLQLLRETFPEEEHIELPTYAFRYPERSKRLGTKVLVEIPSMWRAMKREHKMVDELARKGMIHAVVSDNRYGLWHPVLPNRIICHQLNVKLPANIKGFESVFNRFHRKLLNRFDRIWVPDTPDNHFAGELSHSAELDHKTDYIGSLSRFATMELPKAAQKKYEICFLLSGPEPQRSILEKKIIRQANEMDIPMALVRGLPGSEGEIITNPNMEVYNHLSTPELERVLRQSKRVVCRSGYSSIMDMERIGCPVHFIPTPGQPEQEYLVLHHQQESGIPWSPQSAFTLLDILSREGKSIPQSSAEQNLPGEAVGKFANEF